MLKRSKLFITMIIVIILFAILIVPKTFATTKKGLIGDVNDDGKVSVKDALMINRYLAGKVSLDDEQKKIAFYDE